MTFQSNASFTPVTTIRQYFSLAQDKLLEVDRRHLVPTVYTPGWARLSAAYGKAMLSTQDLTVDIAAYYEEYNDAILKIARDPTRDVASKKKAIQRISKSHNFNVASQEIVDGLEQLSYGLNAIRLELRSLLKQQELEQIRLCSDIKKSEAAINEIDTRIKTVDSNPEPVLGGGLFMYMWCLWIDRHSRKVKLEGLKEQRSALMQKKLASEEKKTQHEPVHTTLLGVDDLIESISGEFSGAIQDALKFSQTLWTELNDRCQELVSQLHLIENLEKRDPLIVSPWVERLRSSNRRLSH